MVPSPTAEYSRFSPLNRQEPPSFLDSTLSSDLDQDGDDPVVTYAELKNLKVTAWKPEHACLTQRQGSGIEETLDSMSRSFGSWMQRLLTGEGAAEVMDMNSPAEEQEAGCKCKVGGDLPCFVVCQ